MNTGFLVNLVILIFAHLLGDFVVRFRWLRKRKRTFTGLLVHSLIHAALAYVLFSAWTLWFIPLVIGVSHLLIDLGKLWARSRRLWLFLLDQGLHGIVLILLAAFLVRAGTGLPFWYAWQPSLFWPILVVACAICCLSLRRLPDRGIDGAISRAAGNILHKIIQGYLQRRNKDC